MVKTYTCRDVGVDCDWSAYSETEEGLMELIAEHAKTYIQRLSSPPNW